MYSIISVTNILVPSITFLVYNIIPFHSLVYIRINKYACTLCLDNHKKFQIQSLSFYVVII